MVDKYKWRKNPKRSTTIKRRQPMLTYVVDKSALNSFTFNSVNLFGEVLVVSLLCKM